jgi:uncharacterized protein (DUF2147 family)
MKKVHLLILVLTSILPFGFTSQDQSGDRLIGVWEPGNGRSRIKIEKIGAKYFGKIVWLKEPIDPNTNKNKVDKNNPDTSMRNVPLKGYRILKDFVYKGKNEWSEGSIYDPENGSTYNCVINMKNDNVLDIRGYIGIKALGRTDNWKRLTVK